MVRYLFILCPAIISILMICCDSTKLPESEYISVSNTQKKDLSSHKTIGRITYSLRYLPIDDMILKEYSGEISKQGTLDSLRNEYGDFQYFTLKLSYQSDGTPQYELLKYELASAEQYQQRLLYCISEISNDIYLENGGKILPCRFSHMVRNFDVASYIEFSLGFDRPQEEQIAIKQYNSPVYSDKTLIFQDKIFGNGKIKLKILGENINNHPKLVYNDK
jgi:hypothetical protein